MGTLLGRVLVIDDDPFMLRVICELLERAGFHVIVQESALGATQVILRERVDAAVIDWDLPLLRGDEVVRLLKTWDEVKDLPVLLITGAADQTLERIYAELPGAHVLRKEEMRELLVSTLGRLLGSGQTVRGMRPIDLSECQTEAPPKPRLQAEGLVPQLLSQLAETMPLADEVWNEASRGRIAGVQALSETLERLAGQARLVALEEAANLLGALADTLRALPANKKASREVRRAVDGGLAALAALPHGGDGALTVPPEPLIGALRKACEELRAA